MNTYVICMDSVWVRDSEMFDIVGLTDEELTDIDMCGTDNEADGTIWSRPHLSQS